jgi:farnesyl-diphosphate farnesyltransferase
VTASSPSGVDLEGLLAQTSRTFALSIPLLPEPTRREVTIAYLLFRIADTFEDAAVWPAAARTEALERFSAFLREPSGNLPEARRLAAGWAAAKPSEHAGYVTLVGQTPAVMEELLALSPAAIAPIREHVLRSAAGMAGFVARTGDSGELTLNDLNDLRDYCYAVAGIVGEMLTELFLLERPELSFAALTLRDRASFFGEALQLVNILKDSDDDAAEGRRYVAAGLDRAEVFALARRDLDSAAEYILALQAAGAPRGLLAFTALPVELAWATLAKVEKEGPGSKISRLEVASIVARLNRALDRGKPAARVRKGRTSGF